MKNRIIFVFLLAIMAAFTVPSFGGNGPVDPAGKGSGIFGFGFGPGIPHYGGNGFGPAILLHYDHSIWQVGPGAISLGGQIGTSFFWHDNSHQDISYKSSWINIGIAFRAAYHYGWKVPGLDTYGGFGAGTVFSMYNDDGYPADRDSFHAGFQPTAFLGASYFFNDRIGLNAEIGYNFAYAAIGLNFRLTK
jgi:hypothetical protein